MYESRTIGNNYNVPFPVVPCVRDAERQSLDCEERHSDRDYNWKTVSKRGTEMQVYMYLRTKSLAALLAAQEKTPRVHGENSNFCALYRPVWSMRILSALSSLQKHHEYVEYLMEKFNAYSEQQIVRVFAIQDKSLFNNHAKILSSPFDARISFVLRPRAHWK